MSKRIDELETVENEAVETVVEELDLDTVYATIVKKDDGYHVVDFDGSEGPVCKVIEEGKTIALTKNKSNRQWFNVKRADAEIAEKGHVDLYYKATRHIGSGAGSTRIPNEKLISYLPQELQAEYKAIIARAIEAKNADKKKPMTELEKAQAKLDKAKAALAKLLGEAGEQA
jgi:hypothetical protein